MVIIKGQDNFTKNLAMAKITDFLNICKFLWSISFLICYNRNMKKDLIEKLADLEHNRWSHWQKYLHSCCITNADGSLTIPKDKVMHWENQIKTKYHALSEKEKDSDRREALKTINCIKQYYKNSKPLGIVVAGFGAIGKSYLGEKYPNIIDMESGNFAHLNDEVFSVPIEKRKGTTIRKPNPEWPQNYFKAIQEARKHYDIVLTSMHWDLLNFFEENNISYYLVFPEQGLEEEYAKRCYSRGNNKKFTEHMIANIKIWNKKLKEFKPKELILLKSGQYLEDVLKEKGIL